MNDTKISNMSRFWASVHMCAGLTAADRKNQRHYFYWLFTWVAALFAASKIIQQQWVAGETTNWLIALLPNIFVVGVILSYRKFIVQADELTRKIQFQGMAWGFASGMLVGFVCMPLQRLGVTGITPWILFEVMILSYSFGSVAAAWKYR